MRKITKRITALIIAAMMLASMIPAAFATTGEETAEPAYNFQFTRASHSLAEGLAVKELVNYTVGNTATGYNEWGFINVWKRNTARVQSDGYSMGTWDITKSYFGYKYDPDNSVLPVFMALEIVIDQPGTYTPSLEWVASDTSPHVDIYLIKAPTDTEEVAAWNTDLAKQTDTEKAQCYKTLSGVSPLGTVKMQPTSDGGDKSGEVELSTVTIADEGKKSYYLVFVPNGASAKVASTFDAKTSGILCYIQPKSFTLTRVADDPIAGAFEVTEATTGYTAPTAIGITKDETEIETTDNEDGTFDLTAPETNSKNEKFLYWALGLTGNKRIVSFDRTLENYMPAEDGRNYLIAVYEGDVDAGKVEYYNQNGQLIPDADETTTVSMPGYGSTSKWKKYSDNIYVADYEKTEAQRDNVTVSAVDGTVNGEVSATVPFGTEVTCEADATKANFKCWKKTNINGDEIVSVDKTYKFKAWETCTVTAVYEEHIYFGEKMKIIIDDFTAGSETGVMAEFIGLDDAVEKGIMFTDSEENTTKIAMTTKDSQFTVIADEDGIYEGYAIVGNVADGYTLITDGSYEKE